MVTQLRKFGDIGEKIAKDFLEKRGYKILEANYSKRWGEIDLIAVSPEKELAFVEIKTREARSASLDIFPEDSVGFSKQQHLVKTAQTFLYENHYTEDTQWRIDVIAISINNVTRKAKIRHIINAVEM